MESHPTYLPLKGAVQRYPRTASAIFQTYNDLVLVQQWSDLELVDLPTCERCGFQGRRPENVSQKSDPCLSETDGLVSFSRRSTLTSVVPCSLTESLSMSWLRSAFSGFEPHEELFLAISAEDSSIVYYKLSMGITKPPL
ncbi:tRNA intron endonuclease [Lactarius sanguifluus]|nr:tRNA intron endonuclease [Lactarius sanguifluus]